ncbi:Rap1a/Tai family immunity protein [Polynucleobacter necessarius]|uniref:Rap1a/Tai family immunity protein n=1 Tax=Polynucleobacter necessarius TaxID=576610 RepID=UPI000FE1FA9D|nr:Rap1a/Tai family immunity protein [Polynucleobacter necessarius]
MKTLTATFILTASILSFVPSAFAQKDLPADDASTAAFVELCKNPDEQGRSFCFGFGEGVYQGYLANRRQDAKPAICFGERSETRNEILQKFLAWSKANPQFNNEKAAKTLMRFFTVNYPCK